MNAEINQLVEKRMLAGDPTDDKQSLFRQQATIISRKKESAAEALREARDDLQRMEMEINDKREAATQGDGEEVLKGDEVRNTSTPDKFPIWCRKMQDNYHLHLTDNFHFHFYFLTLLNHVLGITAICPFEIKCENPY